MLCSRRSASVAPSSDDGMRYPRGSTIGTASQRYQRHPVSCEIDGEIFTGNYWIAGMILVVTTATGGTSRQLANSEPEDLAKSLLTNLVLANRATVLATLREP